MINSITDIKTNNTYYCHLQNVLDEFMENDFFGTEGQNDPRGDFRDCCEECPDCDGEGCDNCDDGYIDDFDNVRVVDENNISSVIENILQLPDEDQELILKELQKLINK